MDGMIGLDDKLRIRLFRSEKKRIKKAALEAQDDAGEKKYRDTSHFVRAAVMRLLREEEKRQEGMSK